MIKALIFDFDGMIIDSESPEFQVWQEVFAEHGRELGFDLWADLIGRPGTISMSTHTFTRISIPRPISSSCAESARRVIALTLEQPVLPGVHEYLRGAGIWV